MRFDYQALQHDGRVVAGLIEASSERAAHRDLLKRGVRPTAIRPQALLRATPRRATRFRPRRDHASVLRQLHALIADGVPIVEAITALADATDDPELVASYVELNASLRRGDPLPQAILQCFPAIPLHVHRIVEAGDMSGRLAEALADAAAELEHAAKIRAELRQALVYPAVLVGFGFLTVVFIFLVVVPRFAAIFQNKFEQLPMLSYLVIAAGMWFRDHLLLAVAAIVAIALAGVYGLRQPSIRDAVLGLTLRLPLVRNWWADIEMARWAAILARLLENRVPLIQSLELARTALRSRDTQLQLSRVERDVRAGAALATALDDASFLPPPPLTLIRVGERSGNLPEMVRGIASAYDEALRQRSRMALAIVEPVAIVLIGGVVGLIAAAIFLAITSINNVPGI
jgi:general secretion pathway protein F